MSDNERQISVALACIFHEDGSVCNVFVKRIDLIRTILTIFAQRKVVPIRFQEKCAVTA
jgi:hypothetical protein